MNAKKRRAPTTGARTSPARMRQSERVALALKQRAAGWTFEAIAAAGGWRSRQAAHDAVTRAIVETVREPADEARELDVLRLDALLAAHFPAAIAGDTAATQTVLKILARRSRLLGLDAPVQAAVRAEVRAETGGVLVVPGVLSEAAWLAEAAQQQDALLAAERSVWEKAGGNA